MLNVDVPLHSPSSAFFQQLTLHSHFLAAANLMSHWPRLSHLTAKREPSRGDKTAQYADKIRHAWTHCIQAVVSWEDLTEGIVVYFHPPGQLYAGMTEPNDPKCLSPSFLTVLESR